MFSASLSLAAKDTPRTGKNIRVYLLSRGGEEMKKRLAVPETPVFCTECLRKRIAYTRSPSTVPRVHSVHQEALSGTECYLGKKEKDLACSEFFKLPEKKRPSQKAQPGMPPRARKSQPKSLQCRPKATQCHSEKPRCPKATQCPQKVDSTPLSKSKKPISELTGFLVVGRRIELLLRD